MINTTVLSEINTKINETQRPTTSPISNTFPVFDTIPGFVFGPIYASSAIYGVEVTMRVPSDKMAPTLRWYPQARPTHALYSDEEKKKCQLGDKKLRGDLNFEEIVYMFFHKTIVRRLKKKFSSRAVWISTTFGATVFDLLKFKQGHFDLVICNCLAVIFLLLWWQQEQQVLITTSSFLLLCRRRMLLVGLRDPSFPYNTRDSLMKGGGLM